MDHKTVLNMMLADCCPSRIIDENTSEFFFEGHCIATTITARHNGDLTFEILDAQTQEC